MAGDLVERLNAHDQWQHWRYPRNPDGPEAADRIAALEAEVGRLSNEYICKCGLRVEPHRCADATGDF